MAPKNKCDYRLTSPAQNKICALCQRISTQLQEQTNTANDVCVLRFIVPICSCPQNTTQLLALTAPVRLGRRAAVGSGSKKNQDIALFFPFTGKVNPRSMKNVKQRLDSSLEDRCRGSRTTSGWNEPPVTSRHPRKARFERFGRYLR